MRVKKTMTEKALAANQENAKRSTGPRNTDAVGQNALRHGLLARAFVFQSSAEEDEFSALEDELERDYEPNSAIESLLVEQLAFCLWRMRRAIAWEERERASRQSKADYFVGALAEQADQIPLLSSAQDSRSITQAGWTCHEFTVKSGTTRSDEEDPGLMSNRTDKTGQLLVQAKLSNPMELALRYYAAAERSFFRALEMLRNLRK